MYSLWMCSLQAFMRQIIKQWRALHLKVPKKPSPRPASEQDYELEVFDSIDDDVCATVDTRGVTQMLTSS